MANQKLKNRLKHLETAKLDPTRTHYLRKLYIEQEPAAAIAKEVERLGGSIQARATDALLKLIIRTHKINVSRLIEAISALPETEVKRIKGSRSWENPSICFKE